MISILIPTKNNPIDLYERIFFYNFFEFKGEILIGDSSNEENIKIFKNLLNKLEIKIKINYLTFPDLSESNTTKRLIKASSFDFLVWSGDDDFFVPKTLYKCVNFLKKNLNFASVHGKGLVLMIENNKILSQWQYKQPNFIGETAEKRLEKYLVSGGDTHYSVHRKSIMVKMYSNVDKFKTHMVSAADLPIYMSIINGNMAEINEYSIIRTVYKKRRHDYKNIFMNGLQDKNWLNDNIKLIDVMSNEICNNEKISYDDAETIVRHFLKEINLNQISKFMEPQIKINFLYLLLAKIKNKFNSILTFKNLRKDDYLENINIELKIIKNIIISNENET